MDPVTPGPLLHEALPPAAGKTPDPGHQAAWDALPESGCDGVLVPEILDGEYPTMDPREFAARLHARLDLPAIPTVTTVRRGPRALDAWLDDAFRRDLPDALYVGAPSSARAYPGPSVCQALRDHRPAGRAGVVTIPTRRRRHLDEPERLLQKQRAGADFAVSQIVTDAHDALELQRAYADALGPGEAPLPIYWSLAPVRRRSDLAWLDRLGVRVRPGVAQRLHGATSADQRLRRSHRLNLDTARTLLDAAEATGQPIGFCASHVRMANLAASIELLGALREVVGEYRRVVAAV